MIQIGQMAGSVNSQRLNELSQYTSSSGNRRLLLHRTHRYYAPAPNRPGIKRCFCLTSVCLTSVWRPSDVCLSRTSGLSREQRGLGRPEVAHVTRDSDTTSKVKGQGHQAALLTAALTREVGAAVTLRTYWAWETTATLRLLGGARGAGAPTRGGEGRGILCRHAHSLL